jgi:hypothetical protein
MKISYEIQQEQSAIFELTYIKDFLKITHDYEDVLLGHMLQTSVSYVENFLRMHITKAIIKTKIEKCQKVLILKYPRINNILSIFLEKNNIQEDVLNSFGVVDYTANKITFAEKCLGQNIYINYQTGFTPDNVPPQIKHGILLHLSKTYEQPDNPIVIDKQIKELLQPHRIIKI